MLTRGINGALALLFRAALLVANIRVGVRRLHTQAVGQLTNRLQLNAFGSISPMERYGSVGSSLVAMFFWLMRNTEALNWLFIPSGSILHARFPPLAFIGSWDVACSSAKLVGVKAVE